MAVADIALNKEPGKNTTLAEIAKRQGIALNYLEQIFLKLRKKGVVKAIKGPGGGYIFTKDPDQIKISEIVHALSGKLNFFRCENNPAIGCMPNSSKCVMHEFWNGLTNAIHSYMDSISLADLVERKK